MGRGQNSLEEEAKRKKVTALSGGKIATGSKGQKSTKAATAVLPRIYLKIRPISTDTGASGNGP